MTSRSANLDSHAAARLTVDVEPYLSCDDCFEQVDARVDALVAGDTDWLPVAFRAHLVGCAACRDEARSLAELAAQDAGVDSRSVLARLDDALA